MTCIIVTFKLALGMILYQVVPLASKPKFVKDEIKFFGQKDTWHPFTPGTVWTECSNVA